MPIPERVSVAGGFNYKRKKNMGYRGSDEMNTATWLDEADVDLKLCVWPRKCCVSGRWMYFERAYKTTRTWTGPGTPIQEHRWYARHEYLMWMIKYS